ncbi:MAG: thioredoxin-disulfide reductase [Ruminococcaceae bacterium]|nr:thioredoxin-disulfide reductase [Oscillospiraceae bacterium]
MEYEAALEIKDGDIKTVVTDFGEYQAKSVIIATGVQNRRLGVKGEDEFIGRGVSFCAVCDGAFYKGKTVAVIGGGNTAVEDAEYLSDIAEKVYLIHRRDAFRAEERLVKRLEERSNVEFVLDSTVQEFCGDADGINGIDVMNVKTGSTSHIALDGAFVAVGQIPQNDIFKGLIAIDDGGFISSGENCLTNKKGIFVAGDCRNKNVRQLTTAVGDGSVAALAAVSFVSEN